MEHDALGSRATTDVIRHGAPKRKSKVFFTVESNRHLTAIFEEQGLEWTDELIIRREILQMDEVSAGSMVRW